MLNKQAFTRDANELIGQINEMLAQLEGFKIDALFAIKRLMSHTDDSDKATYVHLKDALYSLEKSYKHINEELPEVSYYLEKASNSKKD